MLTSQEGFLIALIAAFFVLVFATRLKIELIAILVMLTLGFAGLVTTQQAFSGFSSNVVITLVGLFVVTKGLEETGVAQWIAATLNRIGHGSESKLIALFMTTGASLSLVMNSVAAGAVLLPVAVRVGRASNIRPSKLLMPMAFGTLAGGTATYLTTANIVMSGLLQDRGLKGLGMVDFMPTGGLIVLATLGYMVLIGRRFLPERESHSQALMQPNLQRTYHLSERIWKVRISEHSTLVDKTIGESGIGEKLGLTVLSIQHGRRVVSVPEPGYLIHASDVLFIVGRRERIDAFLEWGNELLDDLNTHDQYPQLMLEPVEAIVAPRSNAVGQTLTELNVRSQFGVMVIALWRGGRSYRTDVGKMPLQVGDALLILGGSEQLQALANSRDFIVPTSDYSALVLRPQKAPFAIGITGIVLAIAILNLLPLPQVVLAGAAAMVLTGCLTMPEFYKAIEWQVVFLVASMLPLSLAIADTGLADHVGTTIVSQLGSYNPLFLIGGMVVLTMLASQIIGGQVTALLVGPIAINAALQMHVNPQAMSVGVATACSMAFLTPIAHPVVILIMGPAGYEFSDIFKVGFGVTIVALVAMLLGLVLFWGIH